MCRMHLYITLFKQLLETRFQILNPVKCIDFKNNFDDLKIWYALKLFVEIVLLMESYKTFVNTYFYS